MPNAPATLSELSQILSHSPGINVRFRTQQGAVGAGYHITELKLAQIQSIDCGGAQSSWQEAHLQLMDGKYGAPQTAEKMQSILEKSVHALPGLGEAPVSVEFAHGNSGLTRFVIGTPEIGDDLTLPLMPQHAQCKALDRMVTNGGGCCG